MSEEQDGFMLNAFGVDLGQAAQNLVEEGSALLGRAAGTVNQAAQSVQGAFEGAVGGVAGAVTGAAKAVASEVTGSPGGAATGSGTGSFPLGGSVGQGGKNAPNDVRAVQNALGISADGQCGGGTIAAIQAFQRDMGQAKPDGRVDAGGATERALAGGARPAAAPTAAPVNDPGGLLGQIASDAGGRLQSAESSIQSSLQSAQDSVLSELGVSAETAQGIKAAEQAVADFDKGRQAGRASGSAGLIDMLPPVQLAKAGIRIANADDGEAEALKIAEEKAKTLETIGKFGADPASLGTAIGEGLGKGAVKANQEGRLAEFTGNLVGQGDVVAATVAVGGAGAGVEAGGARGVAVGVEAGSAEAGAAAAEGGAAAVEGGAAAAEGGAAAAEGGAAAAEGGAGPRTLRGLGEPPRTLSGLGDPIPPTEPGSPPTLRSPTSPLGEPISPLADSVPGSQVGKPVPFEGPPTELPPGESPAPPTQRSASLPSELAESVPSPEGRAVSEGPPTEVDPAAPQPEPPGPKANIAETPAQAQQNLSDALAEQKAATKQANDAAGELVRFRASATDDPAVAEALEDQVRRSEIASNNADLKVRAAQKVVDEAAALAKGPRRGGGFPPPRR